jgi:hypothetical protein
VLFDVLNALQAALPSAPVNTTVQQGSQTSAGKQNAGTSTLSVTGLTAGQDPGGAGQPSPAPTIVVRIDIVVAGTIGDGVCAMQVAICGQPPLTNVIIPTNGQYTIPAPNAVPNTYAGNLVAVFADGTVELGDWYFFIAYPAAPTILQGPESRDIEVTPLALYFVPVADTFGPARQAQVGGLGFTSIPFREREMGFYVDIWDLSYPAVEAWIAQIARAIWLMKNASGNFDLRRGQWIETDDASKLGRGYRLQVMVRDPLSMLPLQVVEITEIDQDVLLEPGDEPPN